MFQTPVLLIIFNRPDTTREVFNIIRQIQPKYFFIAADGPRNNVPGDNEKCIEARSIIELIDWKCEIQTLFRNENRGCGRGPSEAISWFFEKVDKGIILEDDCLPSEYFFTFMEIMLKKYENNPKIMMVAGTNFLGTWKATRQKYFFSSFTHTWGWATWKRAWDLFDYELKNWSKNDSNYRLKNILPNNKIYRRFKEVIDYTKINNEKISWWDFQWCYTTLINHGLCLVPSINLVTNIGIGSDSTHTFNPHDKATPVLKRGAIIGNLIIENPSEEADSKFDKKYFFSVFIKTPNLFKRACNHIFKKIQFYIAEICVIK
jgi:hypothetical protein